MRGVNLRRSNLSQKKIANWPMLLSVVFMLSTLPILSDWLDKRYQVTAEDLVLPLLMALLTSLIISFILLKSFRRNKFGALVGGIFAILILNQNYAGRLNSILPAIESVNPLANLGLGGGVFGSLIFFSIIIGLTFCIIKLINNLISKRNWQMDVFANAIFITISVAFILQLFPTVKTLIVEWPEFSYRPPVITAPMTAPVNKPDIYYIVLDRYTNQNVLQTQLGYDNSDFVNYLGSNGFSINPKANANYPYTTMSIASTLNADYNSDLVQKFATSPLQILEPYHDATRYASVTEKLKSFGYQYYQLGTWYETDNKAPLADYNFQPEGQLTIFNHTFTLNNFAKMKLTDSLYWQFVQPGFRIGKFSVLSYGTISESDATTYKLNQLQNIANQPTGGKFIFAHILVPHDPYYFNADGSLSTTPVDNNTGEPVKQKYLGQVEFINNQMKGLIGKIKQNSHNTAVVLIQADEGPYPMQLNDEQFDSGLVGDELDNNSMLNWSDQNLQMKYGVLGAYDIPKATAADLNQANSVNIFRVIFNTYFDAKMPYLTECSYAYPDGRSQPFVYDDITQRLTGKSNPACPKNSDFK